MRLINLFFVSAFTGILSLFSVGMMQVFFQTSDSNPIMEVKIGFPFWFYSFSTDGNGFHGSNVLNLCYDFLLFFMVWGVLFYLRKTIRG